MTTATSQSFPVTRHLVRSSPALSLVRMDGRSREARYRKQLRAELIRHVGNKPSAVQSQLIEIAIETAFQIETMRQSRAQKPSEQSHRAMLAWQNAYRRTLMQIGIKGEPEQARAA